jgi:hypothetical protein
MIPNKNNWSDFSGKLFFGAPAEKPTAQNNKRNSAGLVPISQLLT